MPTRSRVAHVTRPRREATAGGRPCWRVAVVLVARAVAGEDAQDDREDEDDDSEQGVSHPRGQQDSTHRSGRAAGGRPEQAAAILSVLVGRLRRAVHAVTDSTLIPARVARRTQSAVPTLAAPRR